VALEPDTLNRRQLERNLALNKLENVLILPLALWSHSGTVGWRHGDEPVWHRVRDEGELTQQSVSIDELADKLRLARLDWIKLDIEGAEVEALRGASRTLRDYGPKLFIEVHETKDVVATILHEAGYKVIRELYDQPLDRHGWILAQRS
jgi:FkbM family methyltransferase